LFALLKLPEAKGGLAGDVTQALVGGERFTDFNDFFAAVLKLGGWFNSAKAELPREDWPMMVRFHDLNDPKSVERIDPAAVGVTRILLETTNAPVTTGIEKRLHWLTDEGLTLDPQGRPSFSPAPPLAQTLYQRMFSTEIGK
jgi:hypothetical protein